MLLQIYATELETTIGMSTDTAIIVYDNSDLTFADDMADALDFAELAKYYGYNLLKYTYNRMSFDSAFDELVTAYIFLNPYLSMTAIPEPVIREFKTAPIDKLKEFALAEPIIHDQVEVEKLDVADILMWNTLANGWDTIGCKDYLASIDTLTYSYYRPSPCVPINSSKASNGCVILHPTLPRPLTWAEVTYLQNDNFADWLESELNKLPLLDEPNFFWSAEIDLRWSHRPPKQKVIPAPFKWESQNKKVK